jgi:hypothetical protein
MGESGKEGNGETENGGIGDRGSGLYISLYGGILSKVNGWRAS